MFHPVLNNRGTVTGSADTPQPNPNATNFNPCIGPDPYLSTGLKWENGSLTSLKPLPGGFNITCDAQKQNSSLSGLLHQVIFMMQSAKHRRLHNTVASRQLVSVVAGRNALLVWLRNSRT